MKRKIIISAIIFILIISIPCGLFYFQRQEKVENKVEYKKINDDFHFIVEKKQIV